MKKFLVLAAIFVLALASAFIGFRFWSDSRKR